jgi:hypothetical protein
VRYTPAVGDDYRWPDDGPAGLRDGLTPKEVVDALFGLVSLRLDNRLPPADPTFLAACAATADLSLIVVVCTRTGSREPCTIVGARDAGSNERAMWRKHTS